MNRVKQLLESIFTEISVPQKADVLQKVKHIIAASENAEFAGDKEELQKQLDDLLAFYRYTDENFYTQENQAVYNDFLNKLKTIQQAYQIA